MGYRQSAMESVGLMSISTNLTETSRWKVQILITGHTGFKGGWLTLWLESLGAKVIGYSLDPPTRPSFFQDTGLSQKITDLRGDVREFNTISEVVRKYRAGFCVSSCGTAIGPCFVQNPT